MSSQNYFDLLGDDENEEPTTVITRATLPPSAGRLIAKKSQTAAATAVSARAPATQPSPSEAVREQKPFEAGRGSRGGVRPGRGSRISYGDRDGGSREDGVQREVRDGFSRERGLHNDRNFSTYRENTNDSFQSTRGGSHGAVGAVVTGGGGLGVGVGDKAPRGEGENWSFDGNRGRGGRGGGRWRDRGIVGDAEERPRRREFDRRSGSGFGSEIKRDGSGRGNWGAEVDQRSQQEVVEAAPKEEVEKVVVEGEDKTVESENHAEGAVAVVDYPEKKGEEEDNELTLDEYEKIMDEKRKVLSVGKAEERKVLVDKEFESMQLVEKKIDADVFIKLGSDKEKKKKEREALEKEEKAKKTQSINDFLKPADGEKFYGVTSTRGRARGRGRIAEGRGSEGERGVGAGARSNFLAGLGSTRRVSAPRIEDPGQFPTLGAK